LSQQLIKNTILSNERTWRRKIRELILALHLNVRYSKEKILELYLNKISFGGNSYGVEQASRRFFGKSAQDITILEAAILASLPKSPTIFNPYTNRDRLMGYVYFVDEKEVGAAQEKKVNITSAPQSFELFKKAFSALTWQSDG
jgi:penicillin-binding protein 1A